MHSAQNSPPSANATPYALRRGGISLRLRAEDPQTVTSECGTSLKMLSDHYAYAIADLRHHGPRPADTEWREARNGQIPTVAIAPVPAPRRRHLLLDLFSAQRD